MVGAGSEVRSGMRDLRSIFLGLAISALAGCTSSGLPLLPPSPQVAPEPSSLPAAEEKSLIVAGSPTEVYAQLARGMKGCWFGATGPCIQSHIFHADAEPAAKGGEVEIVFHERDVTLRDQRGVRAFGSVSRREPSGVARDHDRVTRCQRNSVPAMAQGRGGLGERRVGLSAAALFPPPAQPKAETAAKKKGKPKKQGKPNKS